MSVSSGTDPHDLAGALARIPFLTGADPAAAQRLAGLTNVNHLVTTGAGRFVVRLPGRGTSEYIDRAAEEVAARSAAAAGVNAEVLFFDASDGLMATRFVDEARTMDAAAFSDPAAVARAGAVLRRLHTTAAPFLVDFDLFGSIDGYRRLLSERGAPLPDGYDDVERDAVRTRQLLAARPVPLVPSHCDPLCENFLDTGSRMYLIDYEYAANNDPMWDLADLSVEGMFGADQDEVLLEAYLGRSATDAERGRVAAYKALCDLLWSLWGVIQHIDDNPVDDFWAYAVGRFDRCRSFMSSAEYVRRMTALGEAV